MCKHTCKPGQFLPILTILSFYVLTNLIFCTLAYITTTEYVDLSTYMAAHATHHKYTMHQHTPLQYVHKTLHKPYTCRSCCTRGNDKQIKGQRSSDELEQYSLGNESSKEGSSGMKSKTGSSPESVGSRGSSMAGSPTVARTSSSENLFTSGRFVSGSSPPAPSSGASHHVRSASCNVGNLLGGATTGTYSGGGINPGTVSFLNGNICLTSVIECFVS